MRVCREDSRTHRGDPELFPAVQDRIRAHLAFVRGERASYHLRRDQPRTNRRVVSLIIDGADQSVFGLPLFQSQTHSTQKSRIGIKLFGAISHHKGKRRDFFPTHFQVHMCFFAESTTRGANVTKRVLEDGDIVISLLCRSPANHSNWTTRPNKIRTDMCLHSWRGLWFWAC